MCHRPLPSALCTPPNTLPFLSAGYAIPSPLKGHPAFAQLPFPAPGDFSEVYCSHEVWVKGS